MTCKCVPPGSGEEHCTGACSLHNNDAVNVPEEDLCQCGDCRVMRHIHTLESRLAVANQKASIGTCSIHNRRKRYCTYCIDGLLAIAQQGIEHIEDPAMAADARELIRAIVMQSMEASDAR